MNFRDVPHGARFFGREGKLFVKGAHSSYVSHNPNEIPPNAHDPQAPHLYVQFGPLAPVTLADPPAMEERRGDFIVELTRQLHKWQDDTTWLWPADVAQMVLDALRSANPAEPLCLGYIQIDRLADLSGDDECLLCERELADGPVFVALFTDGTTHGPYCDLCASSG